MYSLALPIESTRSNREHLCLIELLDAAFWEKDSSGSFGLSFYSLDQDAIEEGRKGFD